LHHLMRLWREQTNAPVPTKLNPRFQTAGLTADEK
jgi:hypothetical protein